MDEEKLTFSVSEVSKLIGLSRASTYAAIQSGQIPVIKCGKRLLVPKAALLRLLDNPPKIIEPTDLIGNHSY